MRAGLKFSLSLLIACVLFAVFVLLAYSGLFNFIESNFYNPRIKKQLQTRIAGLSAKIRQYHELNIERYSSKLGEEYITRSFQVNQLKEDIQQRSQYFTALKHEFPYFLYCRLIDPEGKRIHFSTLELDIRTKADNSIEYRLPGSEIQHLIFKKDQNGEQEVIWIDGEGERFIYAFPIRDRYKVFKGTALFYVDIQDLSNYLIKIPEYNYSELFTIEDLGFIVNFPREAIESESKDALKKEIASAWSSTKIDLTAPITLGISVYGNRYVLFSDNSSGYGYIGALAPTSIFEIHQSMKIILLVSFFLTVFLIIFLLLNLKHDPLLSIHQRIKHFQINFLKEFIESKETIDWEKWKGDLVANAPVIKKQIRSGIGSIKKARLSEVDTLIDKSWNEIITVIGGKAREGSDDRTDWSRIEKMLQRVVSSGNLVVSAERAGSGIVEEPAVIEEAEAVEIEEAEEAEEAEAVEAVEAVDAVEEVEEAEAVEEAEEVEEAEAVEEAEETEAVEEVDAVEEAEEVEAVEEVESIEETVAIQEAEGAAIEEVEEAEEVEGVGEAEAITEADAIQETEAVAVGREIEQHAEIEEAEKTEVIGYLEVLPEIKELPPEPFEELEMLPLAGENGDGKAMISPSDTLQSESPESDQNPQIPSLLKRGEAIERELTIHSAAKQEAELAQDYDSIIVEEGIYKIESGLYKKDFTDNHELKSLAEDVLNTGYKEDQRGEMILPIPKERFDFNRFVGEFKDPKSYMSRFKALVEISKRINAVSLVVLAEERGEFVPKVTLGLNEVSVEKFKFQTSDSIFNDLISGGKVLILNEQLNRKRYFKNKISEEDAKYIKKALFLPIKFEETEALMFFAFTDQEELNIGSILSQLSFCEVQ